MKDPPDSTPAPDSKRQYLIWLAGLLLLVLLARVWLDEASSPDFLAYSDFKAELRAGRIAEVTIQGDQISGTFLAQGGGVAAAEAEPQRFVTTMPSFDDPGLMTLLEERGVKVKARPAESWLSPLVVGFLPRSAARR